MAPLIVVPTPREAARLRGFANVSIAGPDFHAIQQTIHDVRPPSLIVAGVCGALDPSLEAGAIVLGRSVVAAASKELVPEDGMNEAVRNKFHDTQQPFVYSRLLTVGEPVRTCRTKLALWNEYGAAGVDMETYTIAEQAQAAGIPWVAVRVVVDTAAMTLPRSLSRWRAERDEPTILRHAIRQPDEWIAFIRLAVAFRRAQRALPVAVRLALAATTLFRRRTTY